MASCAFGNPCFTWNTEEKFSRRSHHNLIEYRAVTATDRFYKKTGKYFKESRSVVSARKSDSLARKLLYEDA